MTEYEMDSSESYVIFRIDGQRYGIPSNRVQRVVRIVAITELPGLPEFVLGVINVQGKIIPVISMRLRYGLPERLVELSDQLVIVQMDTHCCAVVADAVEGVCACGAHAITEIDEIMETTPFLKGVAKQPEGMVLLIDTEKLLSVGELHCIEKHLLQVPV